MPKVLVEVTRVRTITETVELEIDVPQDVIDDDEVYEWVEENAKWHEGDGNVSDEDMELSEVEMIED
jgi:hypothetical protein